MSTTPDSNKGPEDGRPQELRKYIVLTATTTTLVFLGLALTVSLWLKAVPLAMHVLKPEPPGQVRIITPAPPPEIRIPEGTTPSATSFDNWKVKTGEIAVLTDPNGAHGEPNYLALADARITKTFPVKRGHKYLLHFFAKGPGIVDWWPGDGDARDIIGTHNGAMQNIRFVPGQVHQAFHFDGTFQPLLAPIGNFRRNDAPISRDWRTSAGANVNNTQIDFGADTANIGTNDFTIDFWVRTTSDVHWCALLEKRPDCSWYRNQFGFRVSFGRIFYEQSSDNVMQGYSFASIRTINDGVNFHHVGLTRHGRLLSMYIDGALDSVLHTDSGIADVNNEVPLVAGQGICQCCDGTTPFHGDLDEIDLFNRALSPAEIKAIYHAGNGGKHSPAGDKPNFKAIIDGVSTSTFTIEDPSGSWQEYSTEFTAPGSSVTIEMKGNPLGVLLDDIQVVPKP